MRKHKRATLFTTRHCQLMFYKHQRIEIEQHLPYKDIGSVDSAQSRTNPQRDVHNCIKTLLIQYENYDNSFKHNNLPNMCRLFMLL